MKVYNGWVLKIEGNEWTVAGSQKLRGVQSYILRGSHGVRSIKRDELLAGMNAKSIQYVTSVVVQ
jgi:hypothetical protein